MNYKTQLKTIEKALKSKLVTKQEAFQLINSARFHHNKEDILAWGKYYFPEKFSAPFCYELHGYLLDTRHEKRQNTLAPRGFAKTTISCFLIPIFQAYNEPDHFEHYLNVQSTSLKAMTINISIKEEIQSNSLLRKDYGDMTSEEKWTERQFMMKNGTIFSAVGTGDSVRGINYRNKRPDNVVLDDLYDEDDINNIDRVNKISRWFWGSIYQCLSNKPHSRIHIQGTAIHKSDLMHSLPKDLWKFKKFQAIKDTQKKEVLWPEFKSFEKLMEDKSQMGSPIFSREMQNEIHDDENALIKEGYIHYYDKLPEKINKYVWSWDTAIKEEEDNDYSVGTYWGETDQGYYLIYMFRKKLTYPKLRDQLKILSRNFPASEILVEDKASGQQIIQELKMSTNLPIIAMMPGRKGDMPKNKYERLKAVTGLFESGKVFFPEKEAYIIDIMEELLNFPGATHDDIVDSISQYLCRQIAKPIFKVMTI